MLARIGRYSALRRFISTGRLYTVDHEWISIKDSIATIGITDYAQKALGDVVYIDLPAKGKQFAKKDAMGAVESVKAASDIYSPLTGSVLESNTLLETSPSLVNTDPYDKENEKEVEGFMDETAYNKFTSE